MHPGMRFSVDPWDPSYGVSLDAAEGQSRQEVDPGVELAVDRWAPIDAPSGVSPPAATLFVDGVRRVDAQVWVNGGAEAPEALPALCASYAAGVICCCPPDGAHLAASEVRRGLVTTAEHAVDVVTAAGRYAVDVISAKANQPPAQALSQRVQGLLNEVEVAAAGQAASGSGWTTICSSSTARCAAATGSPARSATSRPTTRPTSDPELNAVVAAARPRPAHAAVPSDLDRGVEPLHLVPASALRAGGTVGGGRAAGVHRRALRRVGRWRSPGAPR